MKIFRIIPLFLISFWASNQLLAQNIYNLDKIASVELSFKDENWQVLLEQLKLNGKERLEADLVVNGVTYKSVGVRYKGNSSFYNTRSKGLEKLPFNIKTDFKIKDQKIEGKYDRLKLSNVFADPSFIREVLAYEIAGTYTYAPKANFAQLTINGIDFGLYTNTQSIDDEFLQDHFGESDGAFLKCDKADKKINSSSNCGKSYFSSLKYLGPDSTCYYNYYELKSKQGWNPFIELCKIISAKPDEIEHILDVDKTLWMHAYNFVLVNLDSYGGRLCHNYYLYQSKSGQFTPLIWDLNLAFGVFKFPGGGPKLNNKEIIELSLFTHYKDQNKDFPLITNLLSNKLYRNIYLDHVHTILQEYFESGLYYEKALSIHNSIQSAVESDPKKLYSEDLFHKNLDTTVVIDDFGAILGIKELMEQRTDYLMSKPYMNIDRPSISDNSLSLNGLDYEFNVISDNSNLVYLVYREIETDPFKRIEMEGDKGLFKASLECKKGTQYYFIASNGKAVGHFPLRASYEFLTVD